MKHIRRAGLEDIEYVLQHYREVTQHMESCGIYQWDEVYPDRRILTEDIGKGNLYLFERSGHMAAAFVVNQVFDPEYANGCWNAPDSSFAVLHRLSVNPSDQNQGLGKRMLQCAEQLIRQKGYESIRLDAYALNAAAVSLYERAGYLKVGTAELRMGKFYLFEKILAMPC
ncbi:MAG: GNAT family N-acetyltransferase [Lachnospiraceae bacterium]